MQYIAASIASTYHAADQRERPGTGGSVLWKGRTLCGRTVTGISGNAVVTIIDCERCQAVLRRMGYAF